MNLKPCRRCGKLPLLTLRHDARNYADLRCDCGSQIHTPNDPTGEKTAKWWNESQEDPVVTNLEWMKAPERPAEEIVDFFLQVCTPEAMAAYCDQFESCRDCKVAWLNSKRRE